MPVSTNKILWLALTASQLMLVAVVFIIPQSMRAANNSGVEVNVETLSSVAPFVAAALIVLSVILSKFGGVALKVSRPALDRDVGKDPSTTPSARSTVLLIVRGAVHEAIVILGFLLAFLSRDPMQIVPYFAAGFVANLIMFPREQSLLQKS